MGRQPRSGDIPWLAAHSILNWIGGDTSMLVLFTGMSRYMCAGIWTLFPSGISSFQAGSERQLVIPISHLESIRLRLSSQFSPR